MSEDLLGPPLATAFSHHLGERLHLVTFARPSKYVMNLALSVQRSGGVLNVLGSQNDVDPVPAEFEINDAFRRDVDFKFAYGQHEGKENKERGYRRILFKRLLFLWRLAVQLPPQDLLLFVDGDDVLFQRPLDDMVASWHGMVSDAPQGREPVIFMGYPDCGGRFDGDHRDVVYPLPWSQRGVRGAASCARWLAAQPSGTLPFLDSGGYLGRASMVRTVLQDAMEFARLGLDYICMSTLTVTGIRLGPSRLRVDSEARLFYSLKPFRKFDKFSNWTPEVARPLCDPSYFDIMGRPPPFTPTGETPAVLHFVGQSKWYWLNSCISAFSERRRLELIGLGTVGLGGVDGAGDAAGVAAAGAVAGGFANASGRFCFFSDSQCEPCSNGLTDCPCASCQTTQDVFVYHDVDRNLMQHFSFAAVLGGLPGSA